MSVLVDPGGLELKLGGYAVGDALALRDRSLLADVRDYRRTLGSRMMPLDRHEIRTKMPPGPYHVSRKLDGEFTVLAWDGELAFTVNPGGTVRVGLPLALEATRCFIRAGVRRALVAGELYVRPGDGGRERFHQVASVARRPESQAHLELLCFAAFDLIQVDGRPAGSSFVETWRSIQRIFGGGSTVHPVEQVLVRSGLEVERLFERWVEGEGAEGLVARHETAGLFKIKPRRSIDAVVVGFSEGLADRRGQLSELLVALMRRDRTFHLLGRVTGGLSELERRDLLSDLENLAAGSTYLEASPDHVGFRMVRPAVVVELSCLDFLSFNARGAPIERMVLDWQEREGRYEPVRRMPLASAIAPCFVRRRDDKAVDPFDLRLQQVADLVEVPMAHLSARPEVLPKSELLRREVYVKAQKGGRMVRKLLLWKTNKEQTGDFPAYVLFFTDFSPARGVPLEREIRVSSSREQIEALWDALKREKIVRGWERVIEPARAA